MMMEGDYNRKLYISNNEIEEGKIRNRPNRHKTRVDIQKEMQR